MDLERILELKQNEQSFVVATVVSRKAPVSSHLGDKAIILDDGQMEGFIGGACSRDIIRKQALSALKLEQPRLVRITPDPLPAKTEAAGRDEVWVPMSCSSEGAVDVYLEPHLEKKRLLIVGTSPIAIALAKQGDFLGYEVSLAYDKGERSTAEMDLGAAMVKLFEVRHLEHWLGGLSNVQRGKLAAVVASMGHYDEEALAHLIPAQPHYLALVASRKRAATVNEVLDTMGVSDFGRVRSPAGLDINAKSPAEVALSIFAEMVQVYQSAKQQEVSDSRAEHQPRATEEATDPVCGMSVDKAHARHQSELEGATYYFCCPNCKRRFDHDPERYLQAA